MNPRQDANAPLIFVDKLVKTYRSGDEVASIFDGFSLTVSPGETVAVTGESGAGKSTLLSLVAGLDLFQSGSIVACGYDVGSLSEKELARYRNVKLGFIFQFHYLLKDFTALENVMMPALIAGNSGKLVKRRALDLLGLVGLDRHAKRPPDKLSGGERQRVAIARALMNDPELILADEPTGSLDERNADLALELLFRLILADKKTLLMVTHDRLAASKCSRELILGRGVR